MRYLVVLETAPDGRRRVRCRNLPGCTSAGDTLDAGATRSGFPTRAALTVIDRNIELA